MPIITPVFLATLIASTDISVIAVLAVASAVEPSAIVHDLHALACTAVEEVILSTMILIDFLLALRTHLLSEYLLEVH
jgi:hypothetical protein